MNDKAVNPAKLISEMIIPNVNYTSVRFSNVAGLRDS
jgi:hypothetical protein